MSFTEVDIHRLIDGELTPDEAGAVEAWIAADPARAATAARYREINALIHTRFDALLNEPVPPAFTRLATSRPAAANAPRFLRVAGMAVVAAMCIGSGWIAHAWYAGAGRADAVATALPRRAAVAHAVYAPEVRHPVEVGADEEAHLVQWLSKRLSVPVRAPALTRHGFRLVGGRLLPGDDRPVAQFMYQNEAGKRLTLYVVTSQKSQPVATRLHGESSFRFEQVGQVNVFHWNDDLRGYALSGDIPREDLLPIARTVFDDLETRETRSR
jgi:anti-sigma factor RsiW